MKNKIKLSLFLIIAVMLIAAGGVFYLSEYDSVVNGVENKVVDNSESKEHIVAVGNGVKQDSVKKESSSSRLENKTMDKNMISIFENLQIIEILIKRGETEEAKERLAEVSASVFDAYSLNNLKRSEIILNKMRNIHEKLNTEFNESRYIELVSDRIISTVNSADVSNTKEIQQGYDILFSFDNKKLKPYMTKHLYLSSDLEYFAHEYFYAILRKISNNEDFMGDNLEIIEEILTRHEADNDDIIDFQRDIFNIYIDYLIKEKLYNKAVELYQSLPESVKDSTTDASVCRVYWHKFPTLNVDSRNFYYAIVENYLYSAMSINDDDKGLSSIANTFAMMSFMNKKDGEHVASLLYDVSDQLDGGLIFYNDFLNYFSAHYYHIYLRFDNKDDFYNFFNFISNGKFNVSKQLSVGALIHVLHSMRNDKRLYIPEDDIIALYGGLMNGLLDEIDYRWFMPRYVSSVYTNVSQKVIKNNSLEEFEAFYKEYSPYIDVIDFKEQHFDWMKDVVKKIENKEDFEFMHYLLNKILEKENK